MWSSKCHPCTLKPLHWLVCICLCKNHGMSPMQSWSCIFFCTSESANGFLFTFALSLWGIHWLPQKNLLLNVKELMWWQEIWWMKVIQPDEMNLHCWMSYNKMNFIDGMNVDWMWCHQSCGIPWHLKPDGVMSWVQINLLFMNEINPIKFIEFDGWMWSYELEMSWNNHTGANGGN